MTNNIEKLLPAEALAEEIDPAYKELLARDAELLQPVDGWIKDGQVKSHLRAYAVMAQAKAHAGYVHEVEATRKALLEPYEKAVKVINIRLKALAEIGNERKQVLQGLLKELLLDSDDHKLVDPALGMTAHLITREEIAVEDPAKVPAEYLMPDMGKIKAAIKAAQKDDEIPEIPGISVSTIKTPQVR